jgi:hypothetical protein
MVPHGKGGMVRRGKDLDGREIRSGKDRKAMEPVGAHHNDAVSPELAQPVANAPDRAG